MIIDKLEERLTIRYPSSYIKKVHIDKADKDYVLRYRRKDIFADLILYDVESSKPISTIEYDLHGDKCYISYFKTDCINLLKHTLISIKYVVLTVLLALWGI